MSDTLSKIRDLEQEERESMSSAGLFRLATTHRRSNNVVRYHTIKTVAAESVGHHSANVAILCILLAERKPSVQLLMAALLHDMHEQFTGDIPAQAKWESAELSSALASLEKKFDAYFIQYPTLSSEESRILKQADMLDLCFKSLEEINMGNKAFQTILSRGLKFLRDNCPLPATISIMKEITYEQRQ